jgi:hypothetical protein
LTINRASVAMWANERISGAEPKRPATLKKQIYPQGLQKTVADPAHGSDFQHFL